MLDTVARFLSGIAAVRDRDAVRSVVSPIADRMSSQCILQTEELVISSGGAATAKTGAADAYFVAGGSLVKVAASTTLPALSGTIAANKFNVFAFFVDGAGNLTSAIGKEGATLGACRYPEFPKGKALVGALAITHNATFTGGTTPLDTATTVYLTGPIGAFDPNIIPGPF